MRRADGSTFADILTGSIGQLQGLQGTADTYAKQAATGDLKDVHDYMIARNEASLATEMVVGIKNAAVSAFNERQLADRQDPVSWAGSWPSRTSGAAPGRTGSRSG